MDIEDQDVELLGNGEGFITKLSIAHQKEKARFRRYLLIFKSRFEI